MIAVRRAALRPPLTSARMCAPLRPRSLRPRFWNSTSSRRLHEHCERIVAVVLVVDITESRAAMRAPLRPRSLRLRFWNSTTSRKLEGMKAIEHVTAWSLCLWHNHGQPCCSARALAPPQHPRLRTPLSDADF